VTILHGLYVKPLSPIRLLKWLCSVQPFLSLLDIAFKSFLICDSGFPVVFAIIEIKSEVSFKSYVIAVDWQAPHVAVSTKNLRPTVLKQLTKLSWLFTKKCSKCPGFWRQVDWLGYKRF
jgi:hypothetical protein